MKEMRGATDRVATRVDLAQSQAWMLQPSRIQEMKHRPHSLQPTRALHRTGTNKGEGY
jgi:hypothetical protein